VRNEEHKIQVALMDYLVIALKPDAYVFAIPNQANRHISNAVKMKAEGVRAGVPDLCFIMPEGRAAWVEMKTPKGSLSQPQREFRDRCMRLGHPWAMCRSVDEALKVLTEWDLLKPAYRRQG
jgi:hypothetical protein